MCPVYSGPISPYILPSMRIVAGITNANPAAVTTLTTHQYISGTIVRLYVPITYGMFQADKLQGEITVTGPTTFTIDLDTTAFDVFVDPTPVYDPNANPQPRQALYSMVCPIGEVNDLLLAAVVNTLG